MQHMPNQGTTVRYWGRLMQPVLVLATPCKNPDQTRINHWRTISRDQVPDRQHLQISKSAGGIIWRKPYARKSESGVLATNLGYRADLQSIISMHAVRMCTKSICALRQSKYHCSNLWAINIRAQETTNRKGHVAIVEVLYTTIVVVQLNVHLPLAHIDLQTMAANLINAQFVFLHILATVPIEPRTLATPIQASKGSVAATYEIQLPCGGCAQTRMFGIGQLSAWYMIGRKPALKHIFSNQRSRHWTRYYSAARHGQILRAHLTWKSSKWSDISLVNSCKLQLGLSGWACSQSYGTEKSIAHSCSLCCPVTQANAERITTAAEN